MARQRLKVRTDEEVKRSILDKRIKMWGFEDERVIELARFAETHSLEKFLNLDAIYEQRGGV